MSIQYVDIHKAFGSNEVLRGFSLEAKEGETLSIIGHSGAGKSVTLKHAVRLIEPDTGKIIVDDQDIAELNLEQLYELRRKVGYVFQFAALFDSMTIADNVAMGLRRMPDLYEDEIKERVNECLRLVDLEGTGDRFPSEISGGMKKRAGLARAIATEPKYLLYDEPTTGSDPVTGNMINELSMRMKDELGVTGVVITHDMESAYTISDRIAMLHRGRIRTVGTVEETKQTEDQVLRAFIEGRPEMLEENEDDRAQEATA